MYLKFFVCLGHALNIQNIPSLISKKSAGGEHADGSDIDRVTNLNIFKLIYYILPAASIRNRSRLLPLSLFIGSSRIDCLWIFSVTKIEVFNVQSRQFIKTLCRSKGMPVCVLYNKVTHHVWEAEFGNTLRVWDACCLMVCIYVRG